MIADLVGTSVRFQDFQAVLVTVWPPNLFTGRKRAPLADGLVVFRLDRLARDLVLQEQILGDIWRMGAHGFSTSPSEADFLKDDPDDPSRQLIRQVLGAVAQYERALIALRLRLWPQAQGREGRVRLRCSSVRFQGGEQRVGP